MSPDLTRRSASSSKPRISRILAYSPAGVSSRAVTAGPAFRRRALGGPQHRAERWAGVVRRALAGGPHDRVVVVGHHAAVRLAVLPPAVLPVLQVQGDRPAGPAAAVVAAAVVDAAVV